MPDKKVIANSRFMDLQATACSLQRGICLPSRCHPLQPPPINTTRRIFVVAFFCDESISWEDAGLSVCGWEKRDQESLG